MNLSVSFLVRCGFEYVRIHKFRQSITLSDGASGIPNPVFRFFVTTLTLTLLTITHKLSPKGNNAPCTGPSGRAGLQFTWITAPSQAESTKNQQQMDSNIDSPIRSTDMANQGNTARKTIVLNQLDGVG